jgi:HD superfamily phosphohydrolase
MIPLFKSHIQAVLQTKMEQLRMTVLKASKTFEHNRMYTFSEAAKVLSEQYEWSKNDTIRAQCMALYHMYLMFYRDPECEICQRFLRRITTRYNKSLKIQTKNVS